MQEENLSISYGFRNQEVKLVLISEFQYLWTTEKNDYVLVDSEFGYGIINQKTHMIPCISGEEEEEIAIKKMLKAGSRTYEDINEALSNIQLPTLAYIFP